MFCLLAGGSFPPHELQASIMPRSIQHNLSPTDRSAQLAMNAFLTPIEETFAFLEDTMVVKVGYALAAGRLSELNRLVHISVGGGLVLGCTAFLLMLILSYAHTSASALLDPSSSSNAALIDRGCSLVPTSQQLLQHARVYWLLIAATWVPKFMTAGV